MGWLQANRPAYHFRELASLFNSATLHLFLPLREPALGWFSWTNAGVSWAVSWTPALGSVCIDSANPGRDTALTVVGKIILEGLDEMPVENWSVVLVKCREQFPHLKTDAYVGLKNCTLSPNGNTKHLCKTGVWIYSKDVDDFSANSSTQQDESYPIFYWKCSVAFIVLDKVLLLESLCSEHAENMALSKAYVYRLIQAPCALYANCSVTVIYQSREVWKFSYSNCNNGSRS